MKLVSLLMLLFAGAASGRALKGLRSTLIPGGAKAFEGGSSNEGNPS